MEAEPAGEQGGSGELTDGGSFKKICIPAQEERISGPCQWPEARAQGMAVSAPLLALARFASLCTFGDDIIFKNGF